MPTTPWCGAREIRRGLAAYNQAGGEPIRVRIGIHAGEPVEDSNDLFGATVQLAARLCAAAAPDQSLVSAVVRDAAVADAGFADLGERSLKGFAQPVRAFALDPT